MLFDYPDALIGIGYYQGLSIILWYICSIALFIFAAIFFIKAYRIDVKEPKLGYIAYGIFGLFFGLTRLVYIIGVFSPPMYDFYVTLGYIFTVLALLPVLYILETQVFTATKKVFLIISVVCFIFSLFAFIGAASRYLASTIMWILMPFTASVIMGMYLLIALKSEGKLRTKAVLIFIGILLITIGHMMDSELVIVNLSFIPLEVTPIIYIAGIVIFSYTQLFFEPVK